MDPLTDPIDPAWWEPIFVDGEVDKYEAPELLSGRLQMLADEASDEFQKMVLTTLASVTAAMLNPDDWNNPFTPAWQFGDRRGLVPADLEPEHVALLARIAPLIHRHDLRARVADAAWAYGDRSNTALLDMAIASYRAAPLTDDTWFSAGADAWKRAFMLANRLGAAGRALCVEMTTALTDAVGAATVADGFRVVQCSALAREHGRSSDRRAVADALIDLASVASTDEKHRLSRHLEREAVAWLAGQDDAAVHAATDRIGRTYIAEADEAIRSDPVVGAILETIHVEKAIAVFRTLPRSYRDDNGVAAEIIALRGRLDDGRERSLESMIPHVSDPVDATEITAAARAEMTGHPDRTVALARFAAIVPPRSADKIKQQTRDLVEGSISSLFPRVSYDADGRKVAVSPGSAGAMDDHAIWPHVVADITRSAQYLAFAIIEPAREVLTLEYRFDLAYLLALCLDSPFVPEGHAALWATGIYAGLNDDAGTAISVLVPQIEHLVRTLLNRQGVDTLFVDDRTGVESEKSLPALLELDEVVGIFGEGLVLELRALLVVQSGPNYRHNIAHGLMRDEQAWSMLATYIWWVCLRLALLPTLQSLRAAAAEIDQMHEPPPGEAPSDEPSGEG